MSDLQVIEQRLSALEKAMAEMQQRMGFVASGGSMNDIPGDVYQEFLAEVQHPSGNGVEKPNWLDKVGSVEVDEEAFREAMEYGRACRQTGRLPEDEFEEP